jgi:ribosome-associated protein
VGPATRAPAAADPLASAEMDEIPIRGEMIRLGQLLKLAGIVGSGADVRDLLADQRATVNGERETRRGRQLHPGDVVVIGGTELGVIRATYVSPDRER